MNHKKFENIVRKQQRKMPHNKMVRKVLKSIAIGLFLEGKEITEKNILDVYHTGGTK